MKIVGYLQEYSIWYLENQYGHLLTDIKFEQMTHCIYSSVKPTSPTDPTLVEFAGYPWTYLQRVISAAHAKGCKVHISLDDMDSAGIALGPIIDNPTLRAQLITNLKNLVVNYGADGIDIDWESNAQMSTARYDLLVNDLYTALNPIGKTISCYFGSSFYSSPSMIISPAIANSKVDFISIGCYGLYKSTDAELMMDNWAALGYNKGKLIMGIYVDAFSLPDYYTGMTYGQVVNLYNPIDSQNHISATSWPDGSAITNGTIYWFSPNAVRADASWVIANGYGGMMLFDIGQDAIQDLRSLLQNIYNAVQEVNIIKFGLYGNLAKTGMVYDPSSVAIFDQLFDWGWLTPPYPYNNPYYGSTIKAAGRRNILRCSFWDAAGIYPTYQNWTQLRAGGTTAFNAAVTAMSAQINSAGVANLYGYSMYEEEPADALGFVTPTQQQIADFIYCVNQLYTLMKAKFPTLPIMQNPHVMDWFTDAQLSSISFDLLEVHSYSGDLPTLQAYLQRGLRIANGKEFFTLLYCGTSASYDPPGDPTYLAQAVAIAEAVGVTNIGIYCYRDDLSGSGEQIIFNTYTEPSPPPAAWVDPYLHYQAIMTAISSNTQSLVFTPIGNQTIAVGSLLKFLLSATDTSGKTLTYSADNMPTGASLQSDNYFRWTPTASQVGTYPNIYFQVSDGTLTASQYITITVTSSGFTHGTTHAASFQITENPHSEPCQFELWLGPNTSTKLATAGKVNFTSGANVPVTCQITMPAAGTYNVYVDVYMLGVFIERFTGSPITVV